MCLHLLSDIAWKIGIDREVTIFVISDKGVQENELKIFGEKMLFRNTTKAVNAHTSISFKCICFPLEFLRL